MQICPQCKAHNARDAQFCGECKWSLQPLGHYRLLSRAAEGGFGSVYQGFNIRTGYPVAIKLLHTHHLSDAVLQKRFTREMKILQQMQHPHVVRVYDTGLHPDLGPYLVMEWIEGKTFFDLVNEHPDQRLSLKELMPLFLQFLDGLAYIHERKIVHRDLKPQNLMLVQERGRITLKLLDFGIAKGLADEQLTRPGSTLGSPHFMAPEQVHSRYGSIGSHTDLYAAGLILAWALTGDYPFGGNSPQEILMNQCMKPAPRLYTLAPGVSFSEPLELLFAKASQKEQHQRFQSALEFLNALRQVALAQRQDTDEFEDTGIMSSPHAGAPHQNIAPQDNSFLQSLEHALQQPHGNETKQPGFDRTIETHDPSFKGS